VDQPANPRSDGLVYASNENIPPIKQMENIVMHDKVEVKEAVAAALDQRAPKTPNVQL